MADPGTGSLAPPLVVVAPTGPPEGELADALALLLLAAGRGQDDQLAPPQVWRQLVLASLPAAESEYSWPGLRWVRPPSGGPGRDGPVLGVSLALPSARLGRARGQDSARLAGLLDREGRRRLLAALREQEGAVPLVPADGLYLSRLAVAPAARGRGVGAALVIDVLRRARAAGGPAYLHVAADNAVARRLYARHGFVDRAEGRAAGGVRLVLMSTG
ncbi:MAG TPA: GNAT family N-acetyltransferase [Motilibacteraceae bacterium]|nr:GNAT family N-acetyltransferase [Motilibacteraceae bacterium]